MKTPELLVAYLAGFFDGEGCIGITPPRGTTLYALQLTVSNTKRGPLDLFYLRYGGKLCGPKKRGDNCKPIYWWRVESQRAEIAIRELEPYLIIKKEQALLGMKFRSLFKGDSILPRGNAQPSTENEAKRVKIMEARRVCYEQMKTLNKRGT